MQFYSPNIILKFFNNDKEWTTTNSFGITDGIKTYDTVNNKIHFKIVKTYEYWWRPKYQIFVNDDSEYFDANYDIDNDDFEISIFLTTNSNGFVVSEPILRYVSEEELDIIDMIYPVGSIYITIGNTNPSSTLGGSWEKIDDGYYLRASSLDAGNTLGEQLPNIKASWNFGYTGINATTSGAVSRSNAYNHHQAATQKDGGYLTWNFDAHKSNPIYTDNAPVQPKSVKVYMWKRTK